MSTALLAFSFQGLLIFALELPDERLRRRVRPPPGAGRVGRDQRGRLRRPAARRLVLDLRARRRPAGDLPCPRLRPARGVVRRHRPPHRARRRRRPDHWRPRAPCSAPRSLPAPCSRVASSPGTRSRRSPPCCSRCSACAVLNVVHLVAVAALLHEPRTHVDVTGVRRAAASVREAPVVVRDGLRLLRQQPGAARAGPGRGLLVDRHGGLRDLPADPARRARRRRGAGRRPDGTGGRRRLGRLRPRVRAGRTGEPPDRRRAYRDRCPASSTASAPS